MEGFILRIRPITWKCLLHEEIRGLLGVIDIMIPTVPYTLIRGRVSRYPPNDFFQIISNQFRLPLFCFP